MTRVRENRWFTKEGRRKRVPENLKKWWPLVLENKMEFMHGNVESIVKFVARLVHNGLTERWSITVALFGIFGNEHWAFTPERYAAGEQLLIELPGWQKEATR